MGAIIQKSNQEEDYFLDAYLGILPQTDEQKYGQGLLTCADELKHTEAALEKAQEHMERHCAWLTGLLRNLFLALFQRKAAPQRKKNSRSQSQSGDRLEAASVNRALCCASGWLVSLF